MSEHTEANIHEVPPAPPHREEAVTGQSPEQKENKEALVDRMVSPTVARFFALHENKEKAFDTDQQFSDSEAKWIVENDLDKKPSSAEVAADSYEARKAQTEGVTRESWRASMEEEINKWKQSPDTEPILATLKSLHVDTEEDLKPQLDEFRTRYVPSKKDYPNDSQDAYRKRLETGLEQFAEDMAEGCKTEDGKIDIEKFHKRLEASHELLAIFGTQKNVDAKVEKYATAYALAHEQTPADVKDLAKAKIADRLQEKVEDPKEKSILSDLNEQHKKLEEEHQQPAEPEQAQPESDKPQGEDSESNDQTEGYAERPFTDEEINQRINHAAMTAKTKEELQQINEEHHALLQKMEEVRQKTAQGEQIDQAEIEKIQNDLYRTMVEAQQSGSIALKTIDEFKRTLQSMGVPEEDITQLVTEKEAQYKEAFSPEKKLLFLIKLIKLPTEDGQPKFDYDTQIVAITKEELAQQESKQESSAPDQQSEPPNS